MIKRVHKKRNKTPEKLEKETGEEIQLKKKRKSKPKHLDSD